MTKEQKKLFEKLNLKQQRFALNIIEGMSQPKAYEAAGYTSSNEKTLNVKASQLLGKPNMKAFLDSMKYDMLDDAIMNREEIAKELSSIGRANIFDLVSSRENEHGEQVITIKAKRELTKEQQKLVKSIKPTRHGLELVLHDKLAAMKQLSEMQGFNAPEKKEITGRIELTEEQKRLMDKVLDAEY